LSGREFTVSILGTGPHSRVIGIREHIWRTTREHLAGKLANEFPYCRFQIRRFFHFVKTVDSFGGPFSDRLDK
jgi:hypothetical protein